MKVYIWHGELGLFVWDLICVTLLTGLLEFLVIYEIFVYLLTLLLVCCVWYTVHIQLKRKKDVSIESHEPVEDTAHLIPTTTEVEDV